MTETGAEFGSVYRERAALVAFLASVYPSVIAVDDTEPDWPVVYVRTPQGQMSWHIFCEDLGLFPHVEQRPAAEVAWDGHTTPEKYERLSRLTLSRAGIGLSAAP